MMSASIIRSQSIFNLFIFLFFSICSLTDLAAPRPHPQHIAAVVAAAMVASHPTSRHPSNSNAWARPAPPLPTCPCTICPRICWTASNRLPRPAVSSSSSSAAQLAAEWTMQLEVAAQLAAAQQQQQVQQQRRQQQLQMPRISPRATIRILCDAWRPNTTTPIPMSK